ncbi:uncharacterized protein LAESUDRAFT_730980 [Laetiporus sulphureus 93-53]|uniref:Uncharacterized protein n=1 Tax=Laetiporus sulphureus 93-53 TaxID=1314785 RepID=A0A165BUZ1_9APHY|nr:uncharacterized protein LAESUDRAFT_730980 [Laetiporus sulphureus 93-53]KZT01703.1 hypothetical protein LAESUDRAFT_730980 [Laetiporus sulphureus 93-53]
MPIPISNIALKADVDDLGLLAAGSAFELTTDRLKRAYPLILQRLIDLGLAADIDKSDLLLHLSTKHLDLPPVNITPPGLPPRFFRPQPAVRWLGFWLVGQLSF